MKSFIPAPFVWMILGFVLSTAQAFTATHTVQIQSVRLLPAILQIEPGDTVRWENRSSITHTIVNLEGAWEAITLPPNAFYDLVFNQVGEYEYFSEFGTFGSYRGMIRVTVPTPPDNDQCDGAILMSHFGTYIRSTAHATSVNEPSSICDQPVGNGVWFSYAADQSGTVTISTCGSSYDTVIAVYASTSNCGFFSSPIACNDNDGPACAGPQASVTFQAGAGGLYRIFVAGRDDQTGLLNITASEPVPPPPQNDICAGAITLVSGVTNTMNTSYATSQGDPTPPCQTAFGKGVWYSFTPTVSGRVVFSTEGSDFDTVLSIYTGSCDSLTPMPEGCNDQNDTPRAWITFIGEASTTYYILVGGYEEAGGNLHIVAEENYGAPPVNDQCSGAILMTPGVVYKAKTRFATNTDDPSVECGDQLIHGVWYTFMSRTGGLTTISTCGSDFDTVMAIFTGNCGSFMRVLDLCNDNDGPACTGTNASVKFVAAPFVYYRIYVAGVDLGAIGNLQIQASTPIPGTAPANDRCDSAIPLVAGQTYTTDITYATSANEPAITECEAPMRNGVWFTYTAKAEGMVTLSTKGSGFITSIMASTEGCDSSTVVWNGCGSGYDMTLTFIISANQTYHLLIGGAAAEGGVLKVRLEEVLNESNWREMPLPFSPGSSIAQTDSNVVHFVDATDGRLLSLDTETGNFISNIRLYGRAGGSLSFSPDKKELYVSLPNDRRIQVISLMDMATKDLIPLTVQPSSAVVGFDGMFYVMVSNRLTKVDSLNGSAVGSLPQSFYEPILKSNPSGTKLYVMETGMAGAPGLIDEFAIVPAGLPAYTTNYADYPALGMDFVVAEDINRLFAADFSSFREINLANRFVHDWPDGSQTWAVAYLPGGQYVYGAGGDSIRVFDKFTGSVQSTHTFSEVGFPGGNVRPQGLHVTPNGRIFYTRSGDRIGIIGANNLSTNLPSEKEWIDAGTNLTVTASVAFSLQARAPSYASGETYVWSKVQGPGEVQFSAPTNLNTTAIIDTSGSYILQVSRFNGTVVSRDRVFVSVRSPVHILETRVDENRQFKLLFDAPINYFVEASTNLVDWITITHTLDLEGRYSVQDSETNHTQRFYRIRKAN